MPISMSIGIVFYPVLSQLGFLTPYLIFFMLLLSYSNLSFRTIRFSKLHFWLLGIQLIGSVVVYGLLSSLVDPIVAQGVMICVLAPTATSAVVITGMLDGNMSSLTAYSLLSNLAVAVVAPVLFTLIGNNQGEMSFIAEFWEIGQRIFVLLLLPFIISIVISQVSPRTHSFIRKQKSMSFYLWNIALIIVTARTVLFLLTEGQGHFLLVCLIFFLAFVVCAGQFLTGRKLGRKYDDTVAGGQGLGQKNTILAIWMAQSYLNPISSIGPGAYILWQNMINSYQVWRKHH
ncbi:bile acid:Na+ symporter, BASS family [Dysgonomonas macrotermitis]|uniref:Bile acid:Na+ symporter, BASS family n=2 Tax=Dysgonomonas macrotermitis TaxID=1346286 RepID=A0A1M5EKD2_9BACT|nr:bile acid:Na+ symporter, BASS family [Dysgonomonas macrotermitis]